MKQSLGQNWYFPFALFFLHIGLLYDKLELLTFETTILIGKFSTSTSGLENSLEVYKKKSFLFSGVRFYCIIEI